MVTGHLTTYLMITSLVILQGAASLLNNQIYKCSKYFRLTGNRYYRGVASDRAAARDKVIIASKKTTEATHVLTNSAMGAV